MRRFSLVLTALAAAAVAITVAVLARPRDSEISSPGGKGGTPAETAAVQGEPDLPIPPGGKPLPGGRVKGTSAGLALHPLLGPLPGERPAPSTAPGLPRGLDPAEIERIRDENVKTVVEMEEERRKREIAMFEEIMGPLDPDKAPRFLEIYYRYFEDAWRDLRDRMASGEIPNRDEVYRNTRLKAYEKLEAILDPVQLDKFRAWWEEQCR